jgi:protease II
MNEHETAELGALDAALERLDAGHGGGSGRSSERLEIAKVYAFILGLEDIHQ